MASPSLELHVFRSEWAAEVSSWAASSSEVLAWCSGTEVPVPATTIAAWSDDSDVDAFGLFDSDQLVAYGEVWVDHDEAETELARIIVAPGRRDSGMGRELTRLLAARARSVHPDVYLRVRRDNEAAVRCYAAAGFVPLGAPDQERFNIGQPVEYTWMRLDDGGLAPDPAGAVPSRDTP